MNSLTFRLLEVFQEVVDSGSVTAASTSLSLSQPTVSLQLKKLTSVVGLPLLEQLNGKTRMTEAGQIVYRCAQEMMASQTRMRSQIKSLQGMESGSLRIAAVTTAKYVIPPLLGAFCKQHPNIDVNFHVGNREQILERLKNNRDDLYIFSHPPLEEATQADPFMDNDLVVIAPSDYTGPDNCTLHDLAEQKFLLREAGSGTRKSVDEFCREHHFNFIDPMIIESNEAIRLSVASGLGLSILSEHTLAQTAPNSVKKLHVEGFPLCNQWHVVTRKNRPLSLAAQSFKSSVLQEK